MNISRSDRDDLRRIIREELTIRPVELPERLKLPLPLQHSMIWNSKVLEVDWFIHQAAIQAATVIIIHPFCPLTAVIWRVESGWENVAVPVNDAVDPAVNSDISTRMDKDQLPP